jgi:hypothetical protein
MNSKYLLYKIKLYYKYSFFLFCAILKSRHPISSHSPSWLTRNVMTLLAFCRIFSIGQLIKHLPKKKDSKNRNVDIYAVSALLILFLILFLKPNSIFFQLATLYLMVEMLTATLAISVVDTYGSHVGIRSPLRSILLLAIGYLEIIVGFAILYLYNNTIAFSKCDNIVEQPIEALYFSLVTIATLGYGDIYPINQLGRILVILETLTGLVIVAYALSIFITSVPPLKTWSKNYK